MRVNLTIYPLQDTRLPKLLSSGKRRFLSVSGVTSSYLLRVHQVVLLYLSAYSSLRLSRRSQPLVLCRPTPLGRVQTARRSNSDRDRRGQFQVQSRIYPSVPWVSCTNLEKWRMRPYALLTLWDTFSMDQCPTGPWGGTFGSRPCWTGSCKAIRPVQVSNYRLG